MQTVWSSLKREHEWYEGYKPEQILRKTADGSSFPPQAAWPPHRSFWSSSHKPFEATNDHVTRIFAQVEVYSDRDQWEMEDPHWNFPPVNMYHVMQAAFTSIWFAHLLRSFWVMTFHYMERMCACEEVTRGLTRPLVTTCCISRLHCKPINLLFPIQINGCDPHQL